MNLLKTSTTAVILTVSPDTQAITSAVNNLVNAYNSLISFTSLNAGLLSPQIGQRLTSAYNLKAPELNALGITANANGTLTVDQTKLTTAVTNNLAAVKSTFSGANGFTVNLALLGREITTSPFGSFAGPQAYLGNLIPNTYSFPKICIRPQKDSQEN